MIDLVALKAELTADPQGIGYVIDTTGTAGTNQDKTAVRPVADLLNARTRPTTTFRPEVSAQEIINAIDWEDVSTLWETRLRTILSTETVDLSNARIRAAFAAALGAVGGSRARLVALAQRNTSRVEELFSAGDAVTTTQVAYALTDRTF